MYMNIYIVFILPWQDFGSPLNPLAVPLSLVPRYPLLTVENFSPLSS